MDRERVTWQCLMLGVGTAVLSRMCGDGRIGDWNARAGPVATFELAGFDVWGGNGRLDGISRERPFRGFECEHSAYP